MSKAAQIEFEGEVLKPEYIGKVKTIQEFRERFGITVQAINYAIKKGLIDSWCVGNRVTLIILTEKTLKYSPNPSPRRKKI